MFLLAAILSFSAWMSVSEACTSGFGLAQLQTGQLVGQISNVSRDVQPTNVNAVNFAASVDPATQVVTPSQLSCTAFDDTCLWRTSNLSTVPWFQSSYRFDSTVLNYATGTSVQPEGDYAIAVSQSINTTDYAVLESPSFCQVGNGYLQVMVWASNGVKVQACVKANAATSFDYCTLFMTENQPGPFSVSIPTPSQTPLKIYLVATNFNYSDSQYSGGFAALDQLTYMGTPCGQSASSVSPINLFAASNGSSMRPNSMPPSSLPPSSLPSSLPPSTLNPSTGLPSTLPVTTGAPTILTSTITLTTLLTTAGSTQVPTTTSSTTMGMEPERNSTDSPPDVSITQPSNEESTRAHTSTFQFGSSDDTNKTNPSEEEGVSNGSGSGNETPTSEDIQETSGSGSGDEENEDGEMVAAKVEDGSGSASGLESNDGNNESESEAETTPSGFKFGLPADVTASSNTKAANSTQINLTTTQSPKQITTTANSMAGMHMNYAVQPIKQSNPSRNLPERIKNLLDNPEIDEHPTTQSSNQQTLIDQLFNGRKSEIEDEENRLPKEELPQIFLPSNNIHRPNPPQQFIQTTTFQPPWYEFTTLYPNQRRPIEFNGQAYTNLYPQPSSAQMPNNNNEFYLNPPIEKLANQL